MYWDRRLRRSSEGLGPETSPHLLTGASSPPSLARLIYDRLVVNARWLLARYRLLPFTHHGATARNWPASLSLFASSIVLDLFAPRVRVACSLCEAPASHLTQGGEELSHDCLLQKKWDGLTILPTDIVLCRP